MHTNVHTWHWHYLDVIEKLSEYYATAPDHSYSHPATQKRTLDANGQRQRHGQRQRNGTTNMQTDGTTCTVVNAISVVFGF